MFLRGGWSKQEVIKKYKFYNISLKNVSLNENAIKTIALAYPRIMFTENARDEVVGYEALKRKDIREISNATDNL